MKNFPYLVRFCTNTSSRVVSSQVFGRRCLSFSRILTLFSFCLFLWLSASIPSLANNNPKNTPIKSKTYSASIGSWVWLDLNKDGIQDEYEEGLNDFVVILLNKKNNQVISTKTQNHPETGQAGYYCFNGLAASEYFLVFEIPSGFEVSPKDVNNNQTDIIDSDAYPISGATDSIVLKSGEKARNYSIGLCLPVLTNADDTHLNK